MVGSIPPRNFPNAMLARKVGPALATGCTLVARPAIKTPLSALAMAVPAERAGVPAGVRSIITGSDSKALGQELCTNPKVRKLTFTGSTEVGRILMRQCSHDIKKPSLELGGNAPFIVFDDADLDKAGIGTGPQKSLFDKLGHLTGMGGAGNPAWLMSHPKTGDRIAAIVANERKWGVGPSRQGGFKPTLREPRAPGSAAEGLAETRQAGAFEKRAERLGLARKALGLRPHGFDHVRDRIGMLLPEREQKGIRVLAPQPLLAERVAREVGGVPGEDEVGMAGDGGGEDVDIGRIGQPEPGLQPGVRCHGGLGKRGAEGRDLAPRHQLGAGAELHRRPRPFLENALRPERGIEPRPRDPDEDLAQDRRIEHAGIEKRLHPSSRKKSAFR